MRDLTNRRFRPSKVGLVILSGLALGVGGCSSPLSVQGERALQRAVLDSLAREIADARQFPEPRIPDPGPGIEVLNLAPELIPELERMGGPGSYNPRAISGSIGEDLLGRQQQVIPISLETAIKAAVHYNLQVQFARLQPAIAEAQAIAAEAAFDWVLGNVTEFNNLDQPRVRTRTGTAPATGATFDQRQTITNTTSLRRQLPSGGQFTFQQDLSQTELQGGGVRTDPDPSRDLAWTLRYEQPLLQGFGSDVTLAQVRLNRNAERDAIALLKRDLIRAVTDTERLYWQLVQAHRDVLILQRLYDRGLQTRDQAIAREGFDATPAQIAQARATVERRRSELTRAQNTLRLTSDALKAQMNLPSVTAGDETLILPVDEPVVAPISFSLVDVITSSIRNRPEMAQAILSIDNTSIRQQVADNARLPRLDLRLQTRLAAIEEQFGDAYDSLLDGKFVDYVIGLNFEQRIGNRFAESQYRQRRVERMQATIAYRNTAQQVVIEAKRALRGVLTNYTLIGQTQIARLAATENLRSFQVEKALILGFNLQALDLEFRQQDLLALAEREEIAALTDYNQSLALLFQAMGTALERNNIEFVIPDAGDPLLTGGLETIRDSVVDLDEEQYLAPPLQRPTWPWRREAEPITTTHPAPVIVVPPPTVLPPVPHEPPPGAPPLQGPAIPPVRTDPSPVLSPAPAAESPATPPRP